MRSIAQIHIAYFLLVSAAAATAVTRVFLLKLCETMCTLYVQHNFNANKPPEMFSRLFSAVDYEAICSNVTQVTLPSICMRIMFG